MQQLQETLEPRARGRERIRVALVEPRLDRLEGPVTEVVKGEVVELLHEM
jgi:hypothetical protein